ncbi:MAG: aminopeptidase [Candidatus Margulisiibacteriota bacterium]
MDALFPDFFITPILQKRYGLRERQRVLIIYDESKAGIGESFVEAAKRISPHVKVFRLGEERFSEKNLAALLIEIKSGRYSLFVNLFEARPAPEERQARMRIITAQKDKKRFRIAHCPGITEAMLENIDFDAMGDKAHKLHAILKGAKYINVTTPLGTNLELLVKGRRSHDDVFPKSRDLSNLPGGEIFLAPKETGANGVLVVNGTAGDFGILSSPLKFTIKDGQIIDLCWNDPNYNNSLLETIRKALFQDKEASVIGELGIGLAPYSLCGLMLQDEKAAGTIHIAFGGNALFGGMNKTTKSHIDFLVTGPELTVHYADGSARIIMRNGELIL